MCALGVSKNAADELSPSCKVSLFKEATCMLREVFGLDPEDADVRSRLGTTLVDQDDPPYAEVEQILSTIITTAPKVRRTKNYWI